VRYALTGGGRTLAVRVDPRWLAGAAFPVQVDPSVYPSTNTSCTLKSATPTTSDCNAYYVKVGRDSTGALQRAVLRFTTLPASVAQTASIIQARLALGFQSHTNASVTPRVDVVGLAKSIGTSGVTWNSAATGTAWTTPGGDLAADPQPNFTTLQSSYAPGWVSWDVSRFVEQWVRSPASNNGIMLKLHDETSATTDVLSFMGNGYTYTPTVGMGTPTLQVDWEWHPGTESDQTYETQATEDGGRLAVNVATGNVAVTANDIKLTGASGYDLNVTRTFNGQDLGVNHQFGASWIESINGAAAKQFYIWESNARVIYGNNGAIYRFDRDYVHDDTAHDKLAYLSPPNLNATLVVNRLDNTSVLTFADGTTWTYGQTTDGHNSRLLQVADGHGHHVDITYRTSNTWTIDKVTDTDGHLLTWNYGANDALSSITDNAGHTWSYNVAHNSSPSYNLLNGATVNGSTTTYHHQTGNASVYDKVDKLTYASGRHLDLEYGSDGDYSQVTKVTRVTGGTTPDVVTSFKYHPAATVGHACDATVPSTPYADKANVGRTVMTSNSGRVTTYCYNSRAQVIQIWTTDTTAPTIALSGELYDNRTPGTIDEGGEYGLSVASADGTIGTTASGVRQVEISVDGISRLVDDAWLCGQVAGTVCDKTTPFTLNTATLQEGTHAVTVKATDAAGNAATATFTFTMDFSADLDYGTPDDGSCVGDADNPCGSAAARSSSATAAAAISFMWGLADEKGPGPDANPVFAGDPLDDPLLPQLGVSYIRRTFPFDVAQLGASSEMYQRAVNWVRKVFAGGYIPVVTFNSCRTDLKAATPEYPPPGKPAGYCQKAPSYSDYKGAMNAWFTAGDTDPTTKELRDVPVLSAWNEPNLGLKTTNTPNTVINGGEPLAYVNTAGGAASESNSGAFLAGRFSRYLLTMCQNATPSCTAVTPEFLDSAFSKPKAGLTNLARTYLSEFRAGMGHVPMAWGWHAYKDGQEAPSKTAHPAQRWRRLRSFLNATVPTNGSTAPPVLLMEQGPRWESGSTILAMNDTLAAQVIDCYTHSAIHVDSRIKAYFHYLIVGDTHFDTGLRDYKIKPPVDDVRHESVAALAGHDDPGRGCP
jgi:YD repeat-containing protein